MNPKIKNLLIRTLAGSVYATLMILSIYNPWVLTALFLLVIAVGMAESAKLSTTPVDLLTRISWIIAGCLVFLYFCLDFLPFETTSAFVFTHYNLFLIGGCILSIVLLLYYIILDIVKFRQLSAIGFFNLLWIAVPLIIISYNTTTRPSIVLAFLILIWAADTFAYLGGSLLGRHKLCERISPGKTWEGLIISLALTIGLAVVMSRIPYLNSGGFYGSIPGWIGFAAIIVVFGLFGDLFESMLKRKAGVKDSGKLIPGHGGILDRFDSIFVAAYPAFLYVMLF